MEYIHKGSLVATVNGFDVIECQYCRFKHIFPIPTEEELEHTHMHDYYTKEKPLFFNAIKRILNGGIWYILNVMKC